MSDSVAPEEPQAEVTDDDGNAQVEDDTVSFGDVYDPEKGAQFDQNYADRSANSVTDPEDYQINYGEGVEVQPHIDKQFREFARENGVTGEMAQKLVDFSNQLELAKAQDHKLQASKWSEQTKSIPGWQGASYNHNMNVANKALQTFASPELVSLIVESGYQNHPEVIKAFHGIGMRMSEDSYVDNKGPAVRKKTMGEILYPNQPV